MYIWIDTVASDLMDRLSSLYYGFFFIELFMFVSCCDVGVRSEVKRAVSGLVIEIA